MYHASNSSSATGDATQGIVADQFVQNISSPPDGWLTLTVTDFIKADYVSGYGYAAFTFAPVGSGEGNSALGFEAGKNTSDQQLNEFAPYLSITTRSDSGQVPEPGTLLMFALGSAGLVAYRRTRRP